MKKYLLFIFLFFSLTVHANTDVSGTISSNSNWSPTNGAYLIHGNVIVPTDVTLTLEPGTILKFQIGGGGVLTINGSLVAKGTSENKIYFTSLNDDSLGGDTNSDATSTSPTAKDWQGIYFNQESSGDLDYVSVQYGGSGGSGYGDFVGIENNGGDLKINHSIINQNNQKGVWQKNGTTTIDNSVISNHLYFGVMSENGTTTISNTSIQNNAQSGVYYSGTNLFTLSNNNFSGNVKTAFINAGADFVHSGNTSTDITNRGFEISGTPKNNSSWNSQDLPIILYNGYVSVPFGNTLNIDPGTIVKLGNISGNGMLNVDGNLVAHGTNQAKIYFTSLKDDSVGGDTNGDGNTSTPAPMNWQALVFGPSSNVDFQNVSVSYGGASIGLPGLGETIYNSGTFNAGSSFFGHNFSSGVFMDSGTTTISHSEFTAQLYGIRYRGGILSLSNNNFHDNTIFGVLRESGQTVEAQNNWWGSDTGPNNVSTSTPTGVGDKVVDNVIYDPWLKRDPTKPINPVIIIPGILGSAEKDGIWVIDPIFHVYDNLVDTLLLNGYLLDQTLFTFPYDWRKSNVDTATLLKSKIDEVKGVCHCAKVDVVAHSMGGLVAQYYAESSQYANDIDNLIFLGTPHKGATADYLTWEAGEFTGKEGLLLKFIFTLQAKEKGFDNLFDYVRNFPITSVQQLLPIYDYLKPVTNDGLIHYPSGYPINTFLEQLDSKKSVLLTLGINIKNVVGDTGTSTNSVIRIVDSTQLPLWADGYPEGFKIIIGDHGLIKGRGDETVPLVSASLSTETDIVVNSTHTELPTSQESYIYNQLTGSTTSKTINRSIVSRILIAGVLSPADIVLIAPDGKRVGKDFSTGQQINEIPGAFYSGFSTDEEFITIPDPIGGEYKVEVQGTGPGGDYTVKVGNINNDTSTESAYTSTILTNATSTLDFKVNNSTVSNISIHSDEFTDVPIIKSENPIISNKETPLSSSHRKTLIKVVDMSTSTSQAEKVFIKNTVAQKTKDIPAIQPTSTNFQNTAVAFKSLESKWASIGKFLKFDKLKQTLTNIKNWFKKI